MKNLWARIGFTVQVTDEEHKKIKDMMLHNPDEAQNYLNALFKEKGQKDGDSYLPGGIDDNPNSQDFEL